MAACLYGASVKPGNNPNAEIVITRSQWEALTGTSSSWLDPILDTFQPSVVKVSDLCTLNVEDPGDLALSTIVNAFSKNPESLLDMAAWARAKMAYVAFQANCVCNASGTPTCESAYGRPFSPLGSYATNGAGAYDQGIKFTALAAWDITSYAINGEIDDHGTNNIVYKLWDVTAGTLLWTDTKHNASGYQEYSAPSVVTMVVGHVYALTFRWTTGMTIGYGGSYAGHTGTAYSTLGSIDNFPSGTGIPSRTLNTQADPIQPITCIGATTPPVPTVPVQPPDLVLPPSWSCGSTADICTRLQQMSERLDWLRADVTLIQRQHVPFAYLPGVTYSGLTGHNSIGVPAILGASVSLTTVPATWGKTQDVPRRLIPAAGQVLFSTADGDGDPQLLHYDQNLFLGVSGAVTSIRYSLRPGVVASITSLVREP